MNWIVILGDEFLFTIILEKNHFGSCCFMRRQRANTQAKTAILRYAKKCLRTRSKMKWCINESINEAWTSMHAEQNRVDMWDSPYYISCTLALEMQHTRSQMTRVNPDQQSSPSPQVWIKHVRRKWIRTRSKMTKCINESINEALSACMHAEQNRVEHASADTTSAPVGYKSSTA